MMYQTIMRKLLFMKKIKELLAKRICEAIAEMAPGVEIGVSDIVSYMEYPPDEKLGDIALPCFRFSRTLRKAPVMIADSFAKALTGAIGVESAEAVNGYLNIKLDRDHFFDSLVSAVEKEGKGFGSPNKGEGKTVVIDYSSPNVAKPFHIGHLGTTVIGHSLKLIYEFAGYKCIGVNHLGDWGTQFGKLTVAYRNWGSREAVEKGGIDELVALYVRFHEEAEKEPSLNDEARAAFTALENGDESIREIWQWFIDISIAEYKKTYAQLDIEFDYYLGESFYMDKVAPVVKELDGKGLLSIDEGASIVDLEKYGMPPCLILKSDGSTIYPARDIAAALYRKNAYDFDKCVYVTSAGQSLHFAQWFKVVELMGYDWAKDLIHVPYGTVSLNGEKLATRTGNVVLLKDLFAAAVEKAGAIMQEKNPELKDRYDIAEAVGIGAVVFYYLSANRMHDINFVLEDALNFDGNTGPYAQYTYARTCAILQKAENTEVSEIELCDEEYALAKQIARFPEAAEFALESLEPSVITRYILELCAAFNRFYHTCQVIGADKQYQRVRLVKCTNAVLDTALGLICVKHPEKI